MALSRRAFLGGFAHSGVASPVLTALVSARGLEEVTAEWAEWAGGALPTIPPPAADEVRIGGNENPLGPGKHALGALVAQFDQSNRYPFNARVGNRELLATLAHAFDAEPENFVVRAGSSKILRNSSDKAIIAFRKLLLEMTNDLRNGREPEASRQAARYNVRSASVLLEKDVAFDEGAAWLLSAEERPRDKLQTSLTLRRACGTNEPAEGGLCTVQLRFSPCWRLFSRFPAKPGRSHHRTRTSF